MKFPIHQRRLRESDSIHGESNLTHQMLPPGGLNRAFKKRPRPGSTTLAWRFRNGTVDLDYELHVVCSLHFPQAQGRKGVTMDFAIILIVSNTLLAAFIYFVVTRIWQD